MGYKLMHKQTVVEYDTQLLFFLKSGIRKRSDNIIKLGKRSEEALQDFGVCQKEYYLILLLIITIIMRLYMAPF